MIDASTLLFQSTCYNINMASDGYCTEGKFKMKRFMIEPSILQEDIYMIMDIRYIFITRKPIMAEYLTFLLVLDFTI